MLYSQQHIWASVLVPEHASHSVSSVVGNKIHAVEGGRGGPRKRCIQVPVRFWCCWAVPFLSLIVTLMMAENSSNTLGVAEAREAKKAAPSWPSTASRANFMLRRGGY